MLTINLKSIVLCPKPLNDMLSKTVANFEQYFQILFSKFPNLTQFVTENVKFEVTAGLFSCNLQNFLETLSQENKSANLCTLCNV